MSASAQPLARIVLIDVFPGGRIRDVLLVAGSAVFLGLVGNLAVPLPFTPVPLTLATFAVLTTGAVLGPLRAAAGMLLYLSCGVAGVPWFAGHGSGWSFPSFGYIIGYVAAAVVVGLFARGGADRRPSTTALRMAAGNLAIYACGVPWLMASIDVGLTEALRLGVLPFLIGDALKISLATAALPTAWRIVSGPSQ